jgi:uncharacterized membrane protein
LRHALDPGLGVEDAIAVTNHSDSEATFQIAIGSGVVGQDGVFDIAIPSENPKDESPSWVQVKGLDGDQLVLSAQETRVLPVTIAVPADATPGDHPVGITVGVTQGVNVVTTHRVGVRVHLRVSGEITPELQVKVVQAKFTGIWSLFTAGTISIDYQITNTGNTRLGATVAAQVKGPWGLGAAHVRAQPVEELLPGETVTGATQIEIPALFHLNGKVEVTPTVIGSDEVTPPTKTSASFRVTAVPWTVVLLVVAVSTALIWLLVARKRENKDAGNI